MLWQQQRSGVSGGGENQRGVILLHIARHTTATYQQQYRRQHRRQRQRHQARNISGSIGIISGVA